MKALLGRKLRMTSLFQEDGRLIPLTAIQAGPCWVVQVKTLERDGYNAVQVAYQEVTKKRGVNKPLDGHFKRAGVAPHKYLAEFRVEDPTQFQVGQKLTVEQFAEGDLIDVSGRSKGHGFAGVIRRHGFRGGRDSHGSMFNREPGSIGASSDPSRVYPGSRLPGHMGNRTVTVQNLKVVKIDAEHNVLFVRGAVPGKNRVVLRIREARKRRGQ